MTRYIAFLRAVNVGGRTVKMDRLKSAFEALNFANVSTFIASGNVVFDSRRAPAGLEKIIEAQLQAAFGFTVGTMIRSMDDLRGVQAHAAGDGLCGQPGVSLYVGFLKERPAAASVRSVIGLSNGVDRLSVKDRELYWQASKGFADSTITAARLEKLLGTAATLRNVNTVDRIIGKFGNG